MKLVYVSPSDIPSKSANSIHVLKQCIAFSDLGFRVELFASGVPGLKDCIDISQYYGDEKISLLDIKLFKTILNSRLLSIAVFTSFFLRRRIFDRDLTIVSRNLYFSLYLSIVGVQHIYESHGVENGWRYWLQKLIIKRQQKIIVISKALENLLTDKIGVPPRKFHVCHDAADLVVRDNKFESLLPEKKFFAGYFGSLLPGRGIELVLDLAERIPSVDFCIVGGEPSEVIFFSENCSLNNVHFLGHHQNKRTRQIMLRMDALLMPYQESVSIGITGTDTAAWMSPLKMFEYMASEKPIVASDLPVLREVLKHEENSLLVPPSSSKKWVEALNRICMDPSFASKLGSEAFATFNKKYTWTSRAKKMLEM